MGVLFGGAILFILVIYFGLVAPRFWSDAPAVAGQGIPSDWRLLRGASIPPIPAREPRPAVTATLPGTVEGLATGLAGFVAGLARPIPAAWQLSTERPIPPVPLRLIDRAATPAPAPATEPAPAAAPAAVVAPAAPSMAPTPAPTPAPAEPVAKAAPKPKAPAKKKAASGASDAAVAAAPAKPDNLKLIKGIGRQNEAKLNALGITTFAQIAAWSPADEAEMGEKLAFPGRIEREGWVAQAKVLAAGGATEFADRAARGEVESSR